MNLPLISKSIVLSIVVSILALTVSTAQFVQDFDTGDLSIWTGDVNDFIINEDRELQLSAPEAGSSTLLTRIPFPDSVTWEFSVDLDFAPSGSNRLEIWLALDSNDPATANGYKFEIGETGSDDAIRFSMLNGGAETLLAEGIMGEVGSEFDLDIKLTLDSEEVWTLETSPRGSGLFNESFQISIPPELPQPEGYFGLTCTYTSGRVDLFRFDDFRIGVPVADVQAPSLVSATVADARKIVLQFDEVIDESSVLPLSQYDSTLEIAEALISEDSPTQVCLILASDFPSGESIDLEVSGLQDRSGNALSPTLITLILAENPSPGDLVINEILYNPISGNTADFVELLNISDKQLNLDGLFFSRANSTAVDVAVPAGFELEPGEIIAFTQDTNEILDVYEPIVDFNLHQLGITNYVQGEGNVSIILKLQSDTMTIDSFDYTDDFHSDLLTSAQTKGISLERVSGFSPTNDGTNWHSAAASVNFASPGYENSQRSIGLNPEDGMIGLESKVFSPDGDGNQDLLKLNYALDRTGFIANVTIYDDRGRRIRNIADNTLLGQTGTITWDGFLEDGFLAPIGIYILQYDIFNNDGTVLSGREVFVHAQFINR